MPDLAAKAHQVGQRTHMLRTPLQLTESCAALPCCRMVSNNELSGQIENTYNGMSSLQAIYLGNNKFTGTLPSFWGDAPGLRSRLETL